MSAKEGALSILEKEISCLDSEYDEIQKLQAMTAHSETHEIAPNEPTASETTPDEDVDRRSIYVGNVDYSATPHEVQEHFKSCGNINRITIMVDKMSGHPKGFAYVEFEDVDSVQHAILLSETTLKGRQIKVLAKRRNVPAFVRGRGRGRGAAGFRGRGRGYRASYRARGFHGRGYGRPY